MPPHCSNYITLEGACALVAPYSVQNTLELQFEWVDGLIFKQYLPELLKHILNHAQNRLTGRVFLRCNLILNNQRELFFFFFVLYEK